MLKRTEYHQTVRLGVLALSIGIHPFVLANEVAGESIAEQSTVVLQEEIDSKQSSNPSDIDDLQKAIDNSANKNTIEQDTLSDTLTNQKELSVSDDKELETPQGSSSIDSQEKQSLKNRFFNLFSSSKDKQAKNEAEKSSLEIGEGTRQYKAATTSPHLVTDIAYGEALYDFYTDNDFEALVLIKKGFHQGLLSQNAQHAKALETQLLLSLGLPLSASQHLEKLDNSIIDDRTRSISIQQMARIHRYQGNLDEARRLLESDSYEESETLNKGRKILLNQVYLEQEDKDAISNILSDIDLSKVRNFYSLYNVAMSAFLIEDDDLAVSLLTELLIVDYSELETRALRDKVLLTLGQYYLSKNDDEKAREYLSQIGYSGPHSAEALYNLAWIELNQENYKESFTLWVNLSRRNPMDRHVGKSYLIRPYTLEKLESDGLALEGYFYASDLYTKLLSDIESTIDLVKSENWINKLKPPTLSSISMYETVANKPEWIKAPQLEANFLISLYSSDTFASTHQNLWQLDLLLEELKTSKEKFSAYFEEYKNYSGEFSELAPEAKETLRSDKNQALLKRVDDMRSLLSKINQDNGFIQIPDQTQSNNLQQIKRIEERINKESNSDVQDQRRYLEKLKAIQYWDMNQNINGRQWKTKERYQQLLALLSKTSQYYKSINLALENEKYSGLDGRLKELDERLSLKLLQLELLSLKNQKLLQNMALNILESRKEEYKTLLVQSKLAAARLQDKHVTGGAN